MSSDKKIVFPNMQDYFLDKARDGIVLRYADIFFGKYFIYILTPQNILYPCVIYNHTMQPSQYIRHNKPFIHFCHCDIIWSLYDKDSTILKAKIPSNLLFDFQVGLGRHSSNKLFYDVELPFCPKCVEIYEKLFLRFFVSENFEIWNILFATNKILKLEKIAIEDSINLDSRFETFEVEISDRCFYLRRV